MEIVRQLDEKTWREFVDGHPESGIFHTPDMYSVFERTPGYRPSLWAAVGQGGRVLALMLPVQIALLGGPFHRFTTRAVAYGSVLCAPGAEGANALDELLAAYVGAVEGPPLFTELRNLSDLSAAQPILCRHGFNFEGHLNYLIDLARPPEMVMQSIGSRTRKKIRHALRQGEVQVEEVQTRDQVAECYGVLESTYRRVRVPLASRALFETLFERLWSKGMVRFSVARVGGVPAAASVDLLHNGVVYGWYGGMMREYAAYLPTELLTWHMLEWGAENGYRLFDFGGAGKPDEPYGVREFKAKFGGQLVNYGRNTRVHSPRLLRLSTAAYDLYRRLAAIPRA